MRTPTHMPVIKAVFDPHTQRFNQVYVNVYATNRAVDEEFLRKSPLLRNVAAEFDARVDALDQFQYRLATVAKPTPKKDDTP